ncbi:hypothetical protein [Rhodococcus sp. (in: high G+C Gram-positive bacteria)]|uniref:hypothetical protein n=1 Tax=Rhodococcus sp. TaxID=1831 RepID=UPI00388E460A
MARKKARRNPFGARTRRTSVPPAQNHEGESGEQHVVPDAGTGWLVLPTVAISLAASG